MAIKDLVKDLDTNEKKHNFFVFAACENFEPSNYVCWACIQQYKSHPNKRKMIFIYDTFGVATLGGEDSGPGTTLDYSILKNVNLGSDEKKTIQASVKSLVDDAKALKTFEQKKAHFGGGVVGTLKAIAAKGTTKDPKAFDVFAGLLGGFPIGSHAEISTC